MTADPEITALWRKCETDLLDASIVHADSPVSDFTLCGLTLDEDSGTLGRYSTVKSKITCSQCLAIIRHCKQIKIP